MHNRETNLLLKKIDQIENIKSWYSPTAFWPAFNQIKAPKLICVPDVVLTDFPIGFAFVGDNRFLHTFKLVEKMIEGGEHFVTYSEYVKKHTLIEKYGISSKNIRVIPHAPNDLSRWLKIEGNDIDSVNASHRYALTQFASALGKGSNSLYLHPFTKISATHETTIKYFFYASQFRPSKNVLVLLNAYLYLLRTRYVGHKLILTGKLGNNELIDQFVIKHRLQNDVLFLSGLSVSELAACYSCADVTVNPTLAEGGFPFTFTESLSVKTPVIMSNIPVTTEVIKDRKLQQMMLFDPYNWRELAEKLEWAIKHREQLLEAQLPIYVNLAKRNWGHVVDDYVEVLEKLSRSDDHS